MQNSVSSPPSGVLPIRPKSSLKPPIDPTTDRRNDILQPIRLRTATGESGWPL